MDERRIVSARIDDDAYSQARAAADDADVSLSEWIEDLIIENATDNINLTSEEILNMDWDEKVTVVNDYTLSIDPNDYDGNNDEFAEAIIDELGFEYPSDDNNPISPLWLIIPFIGFIIWVIDKACTPKQPE